MKTRVTLLNYLHRARTLAVLFVAIASIVPYAARGEASLEDTVKWLQEKLTGVTASYSTISRCRSSTGYTTVTRTIQSLSVEDGALLLTTKGSAASSEGGNTDGPSRQQSIPLKDLYATCSVEKMKVDIPYVVNCTFEATEVPYTLTIAGRNKHGLYLWIPNEELAKRTAKAFEHLLKLSGSKPDLFQD
jgi:hypothetical protein